MTERTYWRIALTNPPTRRDFLSHAALGRRLLDPDPQRVRHAEGTSVYATEAQARRQARRYPILGGWLAEVRLPAGGAVEVERTLGRPGHHTIWGDPDVLLANVIQVVPV